MKFELKLCDSHFEGDVLIGEVLDLLIFFLKNFDHFLQFFAHFIVDMVALWPVGWVLIKERIIVHGNSLCLNE